MHSIRVAKIRIDAKDHVCDAQLTPGLTFSLFQYARQYERMQFCSAEVATLRACNEMHLTTRVELERVSLSH